MKTRFGAGPVVVGLLPGQDPEVLQCAASLAAATGATLVGAYVDPSSILLEWDPDGDVGRRSLDYAVGPDDDAREAHELRRLVGEAADAAGIKHSFHTLGGDPALALGRLAAAVTAAVIVVGARPPGLLARVDEALSGSVMHKLLATQHVPVLGIPRMDAHARRHG